MRFTNITYKNIRELVNTLVTVLFFGGYFETRVERRIRTEVLGLTCR